MKNRHKPTKQIYKVMWLYYDEQGTDSGVVDIEAFTRKHAEEEFYKLNRKYVTGIDEKTKKPILNPRGGYMCESVLTYREWASDGRPTKI